MIKYAALNMFHSMSSMLMGAIMFQGIPVEAVIALCGIGSAVSLCVALVADKTKCSGV